MQVLDAVARELQLDRVELKQQVVAERPHQRQARRPGDGAIHRSRPRRIENGDGCLLRSSSGNSSARGFRRPRRAPFSMRELFPMRMRGEKCLENAIQDFAARVQRLKAHFAAGSDDFQRRRDGAEIPSRVSLRIFVAGGEIHAALGIQFAQQSIAVRGVRHLGDGSGNDDLAGCGIAFRAHETTFRWGH